MSEQSGPSLETLVSLAKRRGFVFPASEIYGGLSGFYDFGPYGAQLARNLKNRWWADFVAKRPNIYGLDSAIIQNPKVWAASGHIEGFNDPLVECGKCKSRYKQDQIVGDKCPNCSAENSFSPARQFNMMFSTYVGAVSEGELRSRDGDSKVENKSGAGEAVSERKAKITGVPPGTGKAYLRPETAGGIFTNFDQVLETTRAKLPFGIAQIGKAFRNEISPRDWLFRLRELEQMEIEYFVYPEHAEEELNNMKQIAWDWLLNIGLKVDNLSWHQHEQDERAHYAADSWDINYAYPFGAKELWGIANRTTYDLDAHSKGSGKELNYFDPEANTTITPFVIEPSLGVERLLLALLHSAYHEEEVKGEQRVVLRLDKRLAPVQVAVLPLSKKPELSAKAKEVWQKLNQETDLVLEYDETQSIGKRYRRQDEIGTPKCVTVDFESLTDNAVTVRDRDSMEQERVSIDELVKKLA